MLLTVLTKPKPVIQTSATLTLPTPSQVIKAAQARPSARSSQQVLNVVQTLTLKALLAARAAGKPLQAPAGARKKSSL